MAPNHLPVMGVTSSVLLGRDDLDGSGRSVEPWYVWLVSIMYGWAYDELGLVAVLLPKSQNPPALLVGDGGLGGWIAVRERSAERADSGLGP